MKKTSIAVLIILALGVVTYLLLAHKMEAPATGVSGVPAAQTITVSTSTLAEEGTDYTVHADYPQFGTTTIDAQIRDVVSKAADELKQQAASDMPVSQGFPKYEFIGMYSGVYIGPDVISFREMLAQDTGGAHPMPVISGFNFDARTGKQLTLDTALAMTGLTLGQVSAQAKTQLQKSIDTDFIFPDGAEAKAENYGTFLVQKDKVIFIFQPYQVAPYSAGTPEVSFPRK